MSIAPRWRSFVPVALLAGVAMLMLGGCATAIRGTTQRVSVITEPPGAECLLKTRPMETAARIAVTPGETEVRRDGWPLTLSCRRPDFIDHDEEIAAVEARRLDDESKQRAIMGSNVAVSTVAASGPVVAVTAMTTGAGIAAAAVLAPVMIGAAVFLPVSFVVDAFTGAYYAYPPVLPILLTPARFPSDEARAAYAADVHQRIDRAEVALRADTQATCELFMCGRRSEEDSAYIAQQRKLFAAAMAKTRIEQPPSSPAPAVPAPP